jgi:hypothetical protein
MGLYTPLFLKGIFEIFDQLHPQPEGRGFLTG